MSGNEWNSNNLEIKYRVILTSELLFSQSFFASLVSRLRFWQIFSKDKKHYLYLYTNAENEHIVPPVNNFIL